MSFPHGPKNYDALTTGGNIGASAFGSDSVAGAGTSTVRATGLFGSAHAAYFHTVTNQQRHTITAVSGEVWFSWDFQADAPPGTSAVQLVRALNAGGVQQAVVKATSKGIIKLEDDADTVEDSDFEYFGIDGEEGDAPGLDYHALYRIDQAAGTQTLWINRTGHFTKLGPAPLGPDPIVTIEYGICSDTTNFNITFDNTLLTNVAQTIPTQVEVSHVIVGNVLPNSVQILARSLGYDEVRAKVYMPGLLDAILTTDGVSVGPTNQAAIDVLTLSPGTDYEYAVEGFLASTWATTGVTGQFTTAPERYKPADSVEVFFFGCELNNDGSDPTAYTWNYVNGVRPRYIAHLGDLHYDNRTAMTIGPHRDGIAEQFARKDEMRETFANASCLAYNPSDHDGGGTQDAAEQDPSTEYATLAWMDSWPHWEQAYLGGELTRATAGWLGRTKFVFPDFRTLERSNSGDPDTDSKYAYSPAQESWILAHLADVNAALVVMCFDQPWPGNGADVHPKDDHMALYPNQRTRINGAIQARLDAGLGVFIVQADYHGLVGREPGTGIDDTAGGAGLIGIAGTRNNTGNIREDDWPNYDYKWGEEQEPGGDEFNIWVHGELVITDDGETISLVAKGRDNENGVYRITVSDSWDVPYTAPAIEGPSYDLGDLPLTDPFGRWYPTPRTEWPTVPAKAAAVTSFPFTHGQQTSNMFAEGGRVLVEVLVHDFDTAGLHGGRLQLDANVATIKSACAFMFRDQAVPGTTLRFHQEASGPVICEAPAVVLSSVGVNYYGTSSAFVTFAVELEREWTAPTALVWDFDLTDQDGVNERITVLDGSFAPVTNAEHRISGSFETARIKDWQSQGFLRVTVPEGYFVGEPDEDVVPADKAVVIRGYQAWLIDDDDGWDIDDGTNVRGWLDYSPGGLVLYPRPIHSDQEDMGVTINLDIGGKAGNPLYSIRVKKSTY